MAAEFAEPMHAAAATASAAERRAALALHGMSAADRAWKEVGLA